MAIRIFTKNESQKGDELKDAEVYLTDGTNIRSFSFHITNIQTAPVSDFYVNFVNAVYHYKCDVKVIVNNPEPGDTNNIQNIKGDFILWDNDGRRWQFLSNEFIYKNTYRLRSNYIPVNANEPNFTKITTTITFHTTLQKLTGTWEDVNIPSSLNTMPRELFTSLLGQKIWVNDSWHTLTTNDKIYDGTTWRNIN